MQTFETLHQSSVPDMEATIEKPIRSKNHSILEVRIAAALESNYGDQFDVHAQLSLHLSTGKAVPDICLYPSSKTDWFQDKKTMTKPPLMALEILSKGKVMQDLTDKIDLYFGAGVKTYWVVVPTFKIIHIITPDRKYVTYTGGIAKDPVLDIELDMDRVFR